ncbi:hypothetical protein [uncultured Lacinutrix sp.]|uniref:hypothetical protein n=1 Tax=uncultured Lacinutrix sp. TaxID=574032 RepID=UPI0026266C28|nr:hypothetical protein [uncultured Lacinutrix sp.]
MKSKKQKFYFFIFQLIAFQFIIAQNDITNSNLITKYENYSELPREVVYLHLNKSTYIKGEALGLSGYVIDKETKRPSALTTNLYCVIEDSNNKIIKSKLIRVNNGYLKSVFSIDGLFTSGEYTVKAYTNWMKNFDEQNIFIETITIIDPETTSIVKNKTLKNNIDAQFLPESGHLLVEAKNTVGVILKNEDGFGIPDITGTIFDKDNNQITTFKTNKLGVGRFLLTPQNNQDYTVKIDHLGKSFKYKIDSIERKGITLSLSYTDKNVALNFKTNTKTLSSIKNKTYKLAIHNGDLIKITDIKINNLEVSKLIKYDVLSPGINIFTLFDENDKPILERLFFNYNGIDLLKSGKTSITKSSDSLNFKVNLQQLKTGHNINVSILPEGTKSYNRHHNILSYLYLQPYINSYIENAAYYFTNINRQKKYELDNLLITQGWSSYSWNTIFNTVPTNSYLFENGITFKANVNNPKSNQYLIYALKETKGDLFTLNEGETTFQKNGMFPEEGETIRVSEISKKGKTSDPTLYLQFYPTIIPVYETDFFSLKPKANTSTLSTTIPTLKESMLNKTLQLDEVSIETRKELTRTQELEKRSWGDIDVFGDKERRNTPSLAVYFSKKGYISQINNGELILTHRTRGTPVVFLNDVLLTNIGFLSTLDMSVVDYIEILKFGAGEGIRGGDKGVIKIYTDPFRKPSGNLSNKFQEYKIPITFDTKKKMYIPKYRFYKDPFFKEYGVIGWAPNCTIDSNGNLDFKIYNTNTETIKLFIEGMTSDGKYIVDEKTISIN